MAGTLFVFGDLCVDVVAIPTSVPPKGGDATLTRLDVVCGGAAFNCAIAAARAGVSVKIIGLVGEDEFGRMLVTRLGEAGVDTTLLQVRPKSRTGTVLSIASPDGERTFYSYRGVNGEPYGSVSEIEMTAGDGLYLCGYSLQETSSRATALKLKARSNGALCLFDPSFLSASSGETDVLNEFDWITPNAHEAELITGSADPEQAAMILHSLGIRNVAVTLGAAGCFIATAYESQTIPAKPLPSISHSTGAGDAFCGGLLAALLQGCHPFEAARQASYAAASALAHNGNQ